MLRAVSGAVSMCLGADILRRHSIFEIEDVSRDMCVYFDPMDFDRRVLSVVLV